MKLSPTTKTTAASSATSGQTSKLPLDFCILEVCDRVAWEAGVVNKMVREIVSEARQHGLEVFPTIYKRDVRVGCHLCRVHLVERPNGNVNIYRSDLNHVVVWYSSEGKRFYVIPSTEAGNLLNGATYKKIRPGQFQRFEDAWNLLTSPP